jgi:hypothetical protein
MKDSALRWIDSLFMARHGHKWWELDAVYGTIRLLERLGLAWEVVDDQHTKHAHSRPMVTPSG